MRFAKRLSITADTAVSLSVALAGRAARAAMSWLNETPSSLSGSLTILPPARHLPRRFEQFYRFSIVP